MDTITIEGEVFNIETVVGGGVYLTHPQWSLMGRGVDVEAAKASLLEEAQKLARLMADDDLEALSHQAVLMRAFCVTYSGAGFLR